VDHILDQASIEEVVSNYNDVISGQAIAPEQTDEDLTADVDTGEAETADAASEGSDKA